MNPVTTRRGMRHANRHARPDAVLRAIVELLIVLGAMGWLYVAGIAVFKPTGLAVPLATALSIRRDTFAIICFALSAGTYFLREYTIQSSGSGGRYCGRAAAKALLPTISTYSTAIVVYLTANSIAHPETMALPLTHLFGQPTEGAVLAVAVPVSMLSFLVLRVSVQRARTEGADS